MPAGDFSSGLEVWVETKDGGVRLNEYQVEHQRPSASSAHKGRTTCYLETTDEPFIICIKRNQAWSQGYDWQINHTIDGASQMLAYLKTAENPGKFKRIVEKVDGVMCESDLVFSPLATTDDPDKVNMSAEDMKNCGVIEISLSFGTYVKTSSGAYDTMSLKAGVAHEKAKK
ncbi:hypothetical protein IAT38_000954 [Cryptococcus sp. DSM 104549]